MVKKKRPTLQDIADRVGATKMTVSRCLRGGNNVSEHMRERIFAEAEALGYIPNRAPDLLSKSTSHAIGVLLPSLTNQVFADVIKGIESVTECWPTTVTAARWKSGVWPRYCPTTLMA